MKQKLRKMLKAQQPLTAMKINQQRFEILIFAILNFPSLGNESVIFLS